MQNNLKIDNVTIQFAKTKAVLLQNLNIEITAGSITTLMGPSGSGKSTILAYICGTLSPNFSGAGNILLNGKILNNIDPEKRKIGILYQDPLLFPHMNIFENLSFGIPAHYKKAERKERVLHFLNELEMENFGTRLPATLSGGQQARIALMRTLLSEPEALLLDEPFSKLDAELKQRIRNFVFHHAKQNNLPTLLVTHDLQDSKAAGGKVLNLDKYSKHTN